MEKQTNQPGKKKRKTWICQEQYQVISIYLSTSLPGEAWGSTVLWSFKTPTSWISKRSISRFCGFWNGVQGYWFHKACCVYSGPLQLSLKQLWTILLGESNEVIRWHAHPLLPLIHHIINSTCWSPAVTWSLSIFHYTLGCFLQQKALQWLEGFPCLGCKIRIQYGLEIFKLQDSVTQLLLLEPHFRH